MHLRIAAIIVLVSICSTLPASTGHTHARASGTWKASGSPALAIVQEPGYTIAVAGSGWPKKARVTVRVAQGDHSQELEVRTLSDGSFEVGVNNIDLCNGSLFESHDLVGDAATVQGPGLGCAPSQDPPIPQLTVVKGSQAVIKVTHVDEESKHHIRMKIGDAAYFWQSGTKHPAFVASAPGKFFAMIGQGTTPPRACPEVECSQGFFWEWVAIHTGRTGVTLSPWCRQGPNPCMVPDLLVSVRITRR